MFTQWFQQQLSVSQWHWRIREVKCIALCLLSVKKQCHRHKIPGCSIYFLSKLGLQTLLRNYGLPQGCITSHQSLGDYGNAAVTTLLCIKRTTYRRLRTFCLRLYGFNPLLFVKHLFYLSLSIYSLCVAGIACLYKMSEEEAMEPNNTTAKSVEQLPKYFLYTNSSE